MDNLLASFRDPAGFVFTVGGIYYRQINQVYKATFEHFISSGLYQNLVDDNLIISFEEESINLSRNKLNFYKTIRPKQLKTITYSYEWSFSMLKDAALLTLKINQIALQHGMILKDANAYNVQFLDGKPIFIDTLSFEIYKHCNTWQAYRQFCEHFLAPLALMSQTEISLNKLLITHPGGISLELATKLLPFRSRLNLGLYLHIFLHARLGEKNKGKKQVKEKKHLINNLNQILENLGNTIKDLHIKHTKTNWNNYYEINVSKTYLENKKLFFERFISKTEAKTLVDLGANDGVFSLIASKYVNEVISIDADAFCVEYNYQTIKKQANDRILPLVIDIINPSPGIGWENLERISFWERVKPDVIMALALIHHLSITNYLPFEYLAAFFAKKAEYLIIEFVPTEDEKVQILLKNMSRSFEAYSYENFIQTFSQYYKIIEQLTLSPSNRILFLMQRHEKK